MQKMLVTLNTKMGEKSTFNVKRSVTQNMKWGYNIKDAFCVLHGKPTAISKSPYCFGKYDMKI